MCQRIMTTKHLQLNITEINSHVTMPGYMQNDKRKFPKLLCTFIIRFLQRLSGQQCIKPTTTGKKFLFFSCNLHLLNIYMDLILTSLCQIVPKKLLEISFAVVFPNKTDL